jgi:hypothetical protein
MEQDGSEGSEVIEDPDVAYVSDSGSDADSDSDDWGDSTEESGWFADPTVEGQERYYDGHEWTSETRPVGSDSGSDADSDDDFDDWEDSTEESGWFADPSVEGQERYYDGHEWTSETRPVGSDSGSDADPDDWGDSTDDSGWYADPNVEGQERYYDGHEWTSETRPVDSDSGSDADSDADSDDWSDSTEGSGWFADPTVEGQERYFDGHEWTSETRLVDVGGPESHLPDHAGELQRALAAATDDIDEVEDRLGNLFERIERRDERGGRAAKKKADSEVDREVAEAPAGEDDDEDEVWLLEDDDSGVRSNGAAHDLQVAEASADDDDIDDEDEEWLLDDDDGVDGVAPRAEQDLQTAEAPADDDEDVEWLLDDGDEDLGEDVGGGALEVRAEQDYDADDDSLTELDEALASEEPELVKRGLFRRS